MKDVAVPVEELHLHLVQHRALEVVFGPELVVDQTVRLDVAQLALHVSALVAGGDVVQIDDAIQAAVHLDEHALAQAGGLNR